MNKTEWEKLSGRQRDSLIAEKVMGWKWARLNRTDKVLHLMPNEWFMRRGNYPADERDIAGTPKADDGEGGDFFTSQIQCAWLVVERMRERGLEVELQTNHKGWACCFEDEKHYHTDWAPTAPEAICLAALMAIEGLKP